MLIYKHPQKNKTNKKKELKCKRKLLGKREICSSDLGEFCFKLFLKNPNAKRTTTNRKTNPTTLKEIPKCIKNASLQSKKAATGQTLPKGVGCPSKSHHNPPSTFVASLNHHPLGVGSPQGEGILIG